jgi:UDP-glucose 4-epimerase
MNLLVTGGAGYIGGTVSTILMQAGHRVTVLDNLCHSKRAELPVGAEFVEADIADRPRVEALLRELKPDGVLHFAALIEAGESMQKPEIYFRNNTASTLALLEAMHATGTNRLVFSSTAAVYGEPNSTPIEETAALASCSRPALRLATLLQCRWRAPRTRRSPRARDSHHPANPGRRSRPPREY